MLRQALPAGGVDGSRLARRVGVALRRLQQTKAGPAYVNVLRAAGLIRVEVSRPTERDRPAKRRAGTRRPVMSLGKAPQVLHGMQILAVIEVTASDE